MVLVGGSRDGHNSQQDHGAVDSSAVILSTGRPTSAMEGMLGDKRYAVGITFLQGDCFVEKVGDEDGALPSFSSD